MQTIKISPDDAGQRLDRFLRKLLKKAPLSLIQKLVRTKKVKVSGKIQPREYMLQTGDELTLFLRDPEYKSYTLGTKPEREVGEITFSILHEDDDVLVVNKPTGLPSQPGTGYRDASLIDEVLQYLHQDKETSVTFRPALANRIDRGTSGIVLVGKTAAALRDLNKQLAEGTIEKVYTAIVAGIPNPPEGTIDVALQEEDEPDLDKPKMALGSGKTAITHYKTLQIFTNAALLEIIIETGRTHQIRAHLASIGHPVIGDTRYGKIKYKRLMLHSTSVSLKHPETGVTLKVTAPLPEEFTVFRVS